MEYGLVNKNTSASQILEWARVKCVPTLTMPRKELACATINTLRPACRSGLISLAHKGIVRSKVSCKDSDTGINF